MLLPTPTFHMQSPMVIENQARGGEGVLKTSMEKKKV